MFRFMYGIIFLAFAILAGCSYFNSKIAPIVLTPLEDAGCAIETGLTQGAAQSIALALTCQNQAAIQASLMVAMGNANLCKMVQPAVSGQAIKGIVGNIACPIAVNTIIGYLTNSVPATWGCAQGSSVSQLTSVLTQACEAAVPM